MNEQETAGAQVQEPVGQEQEPQAKRGPGRPRKPKPQALVQAEHDVDLALAAGNAGTREMLRDALGRLQQRGLIEWLTPDSWRFTSRGGAALSEFRARVDAATPED